MRVFFRIIDIALVIAVLSQLGWLVMIFYSPAQIVALPGLFLMGIIGFFGEPLCKAGYMSHWVTGEDLLIKSSEKEETT